MRELGDGGGLAAAIDADHQQDLRAREGGDLERFRHRAQDRGDFFRDGFFQLTLGYLEPEAFFGQLGPDPRGCRRAKVRQDQRILDIVERRIVEFCRADDFGEVARQFLGGLAKAPEQPVAPARCVIHCSRPFSICVGVTETIVPAGVPSGTATRAKCGV